jgi:uncharacterized protein YodC (DUF2158 family)
MVVTEARDLDHYKCAWHDDKGSHQEQIYPSAALMRPGEREMAL